MKDDSKGNRASGLTQNGFISPGKYYIQGLSGALRQASLGVVRKQLAGHWKIPTRTLSDIETLSAISSQNWKKLEAGLGTKFEAIKGLCPEGWGGNKFLKSSSDSSSLNQNDQIKWRFIRWEVDVRIQNTCGDTEYQTTVELKNTWGHKLNESPLHSVWAPDASGVSVRDIRAYDPGGELEVISNVSTPTFLAFRVQARRPIRKDAIWRYWWEVTWPRGYGNLWDDDFTYKGESPVEELVLKLVLPREVVPVGCPLMKPPSGKLQQLSWVRLHGHPAVVFWRSHVPVSETIKLLFRCKQHV